MHTSGPITVDNIYELGPTMYRNEAAPIQSFSRTSGLITPQEYYGDERNYPERRRLF